VLRAVVEGRRKKQDEIRKKEIATYPMARFFIIASCEVLFIEGR
jgi:hypothetical protein